MKEHDRMGTADYFKDVRYLVCDILESNSMPKQFPWHGICWKILRIWDTNVNF